MVKKKTYLDIVKKNVSSHILENLWDESISILQDNYLNEGYTLEELQPEPRKFSYTDVVRIAEDFIIHPYSKTCLYKDNVYRIEENGNMVRVPVYLYESYAISEDFWDDVKKIAGYAGDVASGAFNWVKGINIMDIVSDPHTIMDLLSALLVGVGVGTAAMTGGVSTIMCTIAASLVDIANIVWYINDLKTQENPVIRGGIYLGLAFSVVSMTFPIPSPQTITAEGTKIAKLSGREIFKTIGNPKSWLKELIIPGRFPEGRTAELIKLAGAGAAGYDVFGQLIGGTLKNYGLIKEDGETDNVYNWIGLLIGVLVMYKLGRLLTVLGKPFKWFLGLKSVQKLLGVITEFLGTVLNFMKTNGSNILTKLLESIGIKKHLDDIIKMFGDSNFVKQFGSILKGIGKAFEKNAGDSPDLDLTLVQEMPTKELVASYCAKPQNLHYSSTTVNTIANDVTDVLSKATKNLSNEESKTFLSAVEQKILKGESVEPETLTKLLKEVENGKTLDELVGGTSNKLVPTKTTSKLTDDIEKFAETEHGKEIIDSISNTESSILSKYEIDNKIIDKLKRGELPTEKNQLAKLTNAIIDKDVKLSTEAADEFFNTVMPKLGLNGIKKSSIQETKIFFKKLSSKQEKKPYVFVDATSNEFKTVSVSQLRNYKTIYHITTDVIGGKIDNLSARSFFFLLGRATGLDAAARSKEEAAYAFDPIELGLTDVRGGKIISDDYNLFDKLKDSEIVVDLVNLFQDMNWLLFPYVAKAVQGTLETETHTQKAMNIPTGLSNFELDTSSINAGVTFDSIPDSLKNVIKVSKALMNNLKNAYDITNRNVNVDGAITPAYIAGMQELIVGFKKESGGNILVNPINKYKVNLNKIIEDLNILGVYLLSAEEIKKQFPDANV